MKRVALYYRVSTYEQSVDSQALTLREYCRRRGWSEIREYSDTVSGAKFSRKGLDKLMADVRRRSVDAVLCVKLDRLGRSLPHLAQLVGELTSHRVALICPEQGIDTSEENPAGRLQMHVLMAIAEFERELIRDRTRAGLQMALARGVKLGRRKFEMTIDRKIILANWREGRGNGNGCTIESLSKELGCSVGTAHALAKEP